MEHFKVNVDNTGFRPSYRITQRYRNEDCCGFIEQFCHNGQTHSSMPMFDYSTLLDQVQFSKRMGIPTVAIFKIKLKPVVSGTA